MYVCTNNTCVYIVYTDYALRSVYITAVLVIACAINHLLHV